MTACQQPGCTGEIVDGYCTVCGSPGTGGVASPGAVAAVSVAAAPAPAPSPAAILDAGGRPQAAPSNVSGGPCRQPGCHGEIRDGYCTVCGAPADSAPLTEDVTQLTQSSTRLGSTALGSRRAATTGSTATRRLGTGSTRLRSGRLGAGLTRVPPAPTVDPAQAVMANPEVPENRRFCPSCESPVGRSRNGQPGRTDGFCPKCRKPYSFTPKLAAGDLVANQYEVVGCLAHGGLGWIYLARDRNVSDRWVVLKGLLNSGDPDALAAAIAEQQFLAQVEHPLIVEIYNFVTHDGAGYIVMEYVGGRSLKQLLKERMQHNGGVYDPLPPDQALAYILEVLPAFQYLHDLGLVYCDFKPDNIIQVGDALKLIDLGGVRRIDDEESPIYGTVGYQAPEVAHVGPSVASDIYTIGRSIVVLIAEFRGYQSRYRTSLPDDLPIFGQYDSLHRLIVKCCAADPDDRFVNADELRVQLLGVLREVVASKTAGTALTSASSMLFESPSVSSNRLEWWQLPTLRPDSTDPQFGWLSNVSVEDPAERFEALGRAPERSPEVQIARASAALQMGNGRLVQRIVDEMLAADPWEWRAVWLSGLWSLQAGDVAAAQASFNAVYGQVPGELAPKLALAVACEYGGESGIAERLYRTCASTDANYVAAASFGLARVRISGGDLAGAVAALDQVPQTSRGYTEARRLRAQHLLGAGGDDLTELHEAYASIEHVRLDPVDRDQLTAEILSKALTVVHKHGPSRAKIGPWSANDPALRKALEDAYRSLARSAPDSQGRYFLVDQANKIRRWSLT